MPTEETPRQKKHASPAASSPSSPARSAGSARTTSRSFSCLCPVALRPIARTRSTSGASRHSRSTPCPTIPVAPKRTILIPCHLASRAGFYSAVRRARGGRAWQPIVEWQKAPVAATGSDIAPAPLRRIPSPPAVEPAAAEVRMPGPSPSFLEARDFLLAHRTDYITARRDFRWPKLDRFNWALDHFDALAKGNDRTALWVVDEERRSEEHK